MSSVTLNRRNLLLVGGALATFIILGLSYRGSSDEQSSRIPSWISNPIKPAASTPPAYDLTYETTSALAYDTTYETTTYVATTTHSPSPSPTYEAPLPPPWSFNAERDRNNHSLTQEQCLEAFPDLYHEIDRSRAFWKNRQGDTKFTEDQWSLEWSEDGGLRAMIYDNQLYIIESRGLNHFLHWKERSQATLHNIQRAILASKEPIPNIEFSIKIDDNIHLTEDHPNVTVWNFNRDVENPVMEQCWLIPDFNFWAYPRVAGAYGDFQREVIDNANDFNSKIPELVWRGTIVFNPGIRGKLMDAAEGQPWSAVHRVAEDTEDEDAAKWRITMPEHCKYKFAVHTEGTTWSGRIKYLLSCHSAIFVHPLRYTTHLYHLLEPEGANQNYVPVDIEFSDLREKMEELLADNYKANFIADNAARIFRDQYFTPAAQTCYFRRLFQVWSEVTHPPEPYTYTHHPDGSIEKVWRGMTYEEYVFWDKGYPPE